MADFTPTKTEDFVLTYSSDAHFVASIIDHKMDFPSNGMNTLLLFGDVGGGKTNFAEVFLTEFERSYGGDDARIENVICDRSRKFSEVMAELNAKTSTSPFHHQCTKHLFLFDEVDNLAQTSQKCLKSWLNRKDIVCVMTTNHIDKVNEGLRSRSYEVEFNLQRSTKPYIQRMKQMLEQRQLSTLTDMTLDQIVRKHKGDWRKMNLAINKALAV